MNRLRVLSFFSIFLLACQSPNRTRITQLRQITQNEVFETQTSELELPSDQLGFILYDPSKNIILENQNESIPFIPASTSKVPSTIAALDILGPQYRFKTSLSYDGKIVGNKIQGNLYLTGKGDPALKITHLIAFAQNLSKKGIQEVSGQFYFDESFFPSAETIEVARESWAPFNSGVSALSLDFNQMSVVWKPTALKEEQEVYSIPNLPFVQFALSSQILPSETQFIYQDDRWLLSPHLVRGGKDRLPIKKPGLSTAYLFSHLAQLEGVKIGVPKLGITPKKTTILATHLSPPLVELVDANLEYSNNLMTELIQLTAARELTHSPVKIDEAAKLLAEWLQKKTHIEPYFFANGSGLSAQNRISPKQMISILNFGDRIDLGESRSFESLLSISGYKGYISHRLSSPDLAFRVRAKTGLMNYSHTIVGYLRPNSGKKLLFAIMGTDFKRRAQLDQTSELLSDSQAKEIEAWNRKMQKIEDQILTQWIRKY